MFLRLLLIIPIIFIPNTERFDVETGIPVLNLTNILLLVIVAVLVSGQGERVLPRSKGELTAPLLALFAILAVGFVFAQIVMPKNILADTVYLKNAIFFPLFYFIYRNCRQDLAFTRKLILLVMFVAVVAGLEAIRQGLAYGIGNYSATTRASGPFGADFRNANLAGVFFVIYLPLFVAAALFLRKQKFWRLAAIGGCAIIGLGIMVTYSRQSYLIALVCGAILLMRKNLALAILLGALAIPALSLVPDSVSQRVQETQQQGVATEAQYDSSAASRFVIWKGAMQMWQDHPLGVGLNRFKQHIGKYSPTYAGYDAHNFYVLTFAEFGPLGLGVLAWLFWRFWRLTRKVELSASEEDSEARALAFGFTLAVLAMALGNMYGSRIFSGTMMANFWILCGLMERYAALKQAANATSDAMVPVDAPAALVDRFPLTARISPGRRIHRG